MGSNKKFNSHLKKIEQKNSELGFLDGANYSRHIFETALVKIFGKSLGLTVSDHLLRVGLKEETK